MVSDKFQLDSNAYRAAGFAPHGMTEGWVEGDVIRTHTTGPFNIEGLAAIARMRQDLLKNWTVKGPFAFVVVWHRSMLCSPEALAAYTKDVEAYALYGVSKPSAVAWVADDSVEGRGFMRGKFTDLFAKAGMPFAMFASETEAEVWVRAQLAQASDKGAQ